VIAEKDDIANRSWIKLTESTTHGATYAPQRRTRPKRSALL
jgi:hypothetical protein